MQHSSGQIEHFKNFVHDKSMKVGGLQCIITNDEYVMPINFINGLPYVPMRPYTDEEWVKLPHVLLTADKKWDPRVLDNSIDDIEEWKKSRTNTSTPGTLVNVQGNVPWTFNHIHAYDTAIQDTSWWIYRAAEKLVCFLSRNRFGVSLGQTPQLSVHSRKKLRSRTDISRQENKITHDRVSEVQFTPARNCAPEQDTAVQKILLSTCRSRRDRPTK